jgi:general secretion pathway protein A
VQPPASLKALADPIYEAFYGLTDQPFAITTDPKFFYLSGSHQAAFSELLNGLRRQEGVLLLTGETGTGKTTLCRAVLEALGSRAFSTVIHNPYLSGIEILRILLRDFGLVSDEEIARGTLNGAAISQLVTTLERFLRSLASLRGQAVVVLDEAQSLAPQVLDQIRLLTALEHNGRRLIQIILCGQPALLNTLRAPALAALGDRLSRRVTLSPLGPQDVDAYIHHRIAIAGGARAVSFAPGAAKAVAEATRGLPRRINVLCDRALQEGRIEGASVITVELVERATRSPAASTGVRAPDRPPAPAEADAAEGPVLSFSFGREPAPSRRLRRAVLVIAGGLIAALILGYGYYAYTVATAVRQMPSAPAPPARDVGIPAKPLEVPPDAPIEPPAPPSGQLPGNPDQLN